MRLNLRDIKKISQGKRNSKPRLAPLCAKNVQIWLINIPAQIIKPAHEQLGWHFYFKQI